MCKFKWKILSFVSLSLPLSIFFPLSYDWYTHTSLHWLAGTCKTRLATEYTQKYCTYSLHSIYLEYNDWLFSGHVSGWVRPITEKNDNKRISLNPQFICVVMVTIDLWTKDHAFDIAVFFFVLSASSIFTLIYVNLLWKRIHLVNSIIRLKK